MSWTQSDLTALETAIATGALEVRFENRTVTYRTLADMFSIRRIMRRSLGLDTSEATHYSVFRKGPRPGFFPGSGRHRTGME